MSTRSWHLRNVLATTAALLAVVAALNQVASANADTAPPGPQPIVLAKCKISHPALGPTILVTVFGEAHNFLVDTGSVVSVVDVRFKSRMGAPLPEKANVEAGGRATREELFRGPDIHVDNYLLPRSPKVLCTDLSTMRDEEGECICGILGLDVLQCFAVQIDVTREEILFMTSAPTGCGTPVPMRVDAKATVGADVPGFGQLQFIVDTGALRCSGVKIHDLIFDCLNSAGMIGDIRKEEVWTIHGKRRDRAGTLGTIRLGGHDFGQCHVAAWYQCVIGWEFLAGFDRLTFDFPAKTMFVVNHACSAEERELQAAVSIRPLPMERPIPPAPGINHFPRRGNYNCKREFRSADGTAKCLPRELVMIGESNLFALALASWALFGSKFVRRSRIRRLSDFFNRPR